MIIDWNLVLRLVVAGVMGGVIGLERELRAKEAGIRTHFIVALGSALFMIISQYAFTGQFDHARVAAQVVSGIGFIGAGVIIFQKNAVRGVTTAAGLWVSAAVGLACGAGMYAVSAAASILTVFCLEMMHFFHIRYGEKVVNLTLRSSDNQDLVRVLEILRKDKTNIESYSVSDGHIHMALRMRQKDYIEKLEDLLGLLDGFTVEELN